MFKTLASAGLCLTILCSCATQSAMAPLPKGQPVSVVVALSPRAEGNYPIHHQALADGAKGGTASGALLGAASGLACGPLMFFCIPAGFLVGAGTGAVAGVAVGATGLLLGENAAQLRARLKRMEQAHPLVDELRVNVTDRARRHWALTSDLAGPAVSVELQDVELTATRDEFIGFILRAQVTVRRQGAAPQQKIYEYTSPLSRLSVWLDEGSDFLDTSFSTASQQLATQIVSELALN